MERRGLGGAWWSTRATVGALCQAGTSWCSPGVAFTGRAAVPPPHVGASLPPEKNGCPQVSTCPHTLPSALPSVSRFPGVGDACREAVLVCLENKVRTP